MSAENISDAEMLMDIGIDHKTDLTLEWEEQQIIMAELAALRAKLAETEGKPRTLELRIESLNSDLRAATARADKLAEALEELHNAYTPGKIGLLGSPEVLRDRRVAAHVAAITLVAAHRAGKDEKPSEPDDDDEIELGKPDEITPEMRAMLLSPATKTIDIETLRDIHRLPPCVSDADLRAEAMSHGYTVK